MPLRCESTQVISDLYQITGRYVLSKCLKLVKDRELAEEILQETFVKLCKIKPHFDDAKQAYSWLYKTATHLCVDRLRSAEHKLKVCLPSEGWDQLSQELNIEQRMIDQETVTRFLHKLNARDMEIIMYIYFDGMTQQEVVELTKLSRATVTRTIDAFRGQIKNKGGVCQS